MNRRFRSFRLLNFLALSLTAAFLLFFGGCGGVSHKPVPMQAPANLTYTPGTAVYIQGTPIPANSPTSTGGALTSYSVTPPLPGGLFLSTSTGVISGTAVKATALTIYTVTASNSAGSITTPLTITVNIAPPAALAYSSPTALYTMGVPIPENVPTSTGGPPTTFGVAPNITYAYSVRPSLPPGLTLNANPQPFGAVGGIISGTPTAVAGSGTYTVTAFQPGRLHDGEPDHHRGRRGCVSRGSRL